MMDDKPMHRNKMYDDMTLDSIQARSEYATVVTSALRAQV